MKDLRKNATIGKPNAVFFERGEFCDKGMNLQLQGLNEEQKETLIGFVFSDKDCLLAKPFKQGDYKDWIMIEFFTNSKEDSLLASRKIVEKMELSTEDILGI
jgi:hypothetical protein